MSLREGSESGATIYFNSAGCGVEWLETGTVYDAKELAISRGTKVGPVLVCANPFPQNSRRIRAIRWIAKAGVVKS